jgi:hypothetical protein
VPELNSSHPELPADTAFAVRIITKPVLEDCPDPLTTLIVPPTLEESTV